MDPAGFNVRVVHGPRSKSPAPRRSLVQNLETPRTRVNAMQRPPLDAANVLRLGHAVLSVVDFYKGVRWYNVSDEHQDIVKMAKFQVEFVADGVRPMMAAAPLLAHIEILNGNNAGKQMALTKPQTTLGRTGVQVAVIERHPDVYTLTHIEGEQPPLVNGVALGKQARPLGHGDVIDLGGTQMAFRIG